LPIAIRDEEYLTDGEMEDLLRTVDEVAVYMGMELEYEEDDDVRPKDFEEDLSVSSELVFVPDRRLAILKLGGIFWPENLADLYTQDHLKTCEDAFHRSLERARGSVPDYDEDQRSVGKVHGTVIDRMVRVYARPTDASQDTGEPTQT
jgi:hypothetical protein